MNDYGVVQIDGWDAYPLFATLLVAAVPLAVMVVISLLVGEKERAIGFVFLGAFVSCVIVLGFGIFGEIPHDNAIRVEALESRGLVNVEFNRDDFTAEDEKTGQYVRGVITLIPGSKDRWQIWRYDPVDIKQYGDYN